MSKYNKCINECKKHFIDNKSSSILKKISNIYLSKCIEVTKDKKLKVINKNIFSLT